MLGFLQHAFSPAPLASTAGWFWADVQLLGYLDLGRVEVRKDGESYLTRDGRVFSAASVYCLTPADPPAPESAPAGSGAKFDPEQCLSGDEAELVLDVLREEQRRCSERAGEIIQKAMAVLRHHTNW